MTSVVIEEIPDKVTLAVDISNCQGNCIGCHSPFLKTDIGEELTEEIIDELVDANFGVDCFLFLGEGRDPQALIRLAAHVRTLGLAPALYSGRTEVEDALFQVFDYVKVGPYIAEFGPLNSKTTNQRLYRVHHKSAASAKSSVSSSEAADSAALSSRTGETLVASASAPGAAYTLEDITFRFWHKGIDENVK